MQDFYSHYSVLQRVFPAPTLDGTAKEASNNVAGAVYLLGRGGWEAAWLGGSTGSPKLLVTRFGKWRETEQQRSSAPVQDWYWWPSVNVREGVVMGKGHLQETCERMRVLPRDPWCSVTPEDVTVSGPFKFSRPPYHCRRRLGSHQRYILLVFYKLSQFLRQFRLNLMLFLRSTPVAAWEVMDTANDHHHNMYV